MFMQAIRDALIFATLIVGMVGVPGLIWLWADWKFRWGWWFPAKR